MTRPARAMTGVVTGALLITTMGFGSSPAAAATSAATPTGLSFKGVSLKTRTAMVPKSKPTLLARARTMLQRNRIVKIAREQIGDKYVAGHTGPNAFDCSGLTSYVYTLATGKTIPRTSWTQYRSVSKVSRTKVMPGDLVFFFKRGVHHVGVYVGAGKMVHAARPKDGVEIVNLADDWFSTHLSGFGRMLPAL